MIEERQAHAPEYGGVAKTLHWLIVALLIAQYAVGWIMPGVHRGTEPQGLIAVHLSIGVTILVLAVLRLLWRLSHPVPLITDHVPAWQNAAARATHGLLYLLLFVVPLLGWADASLRGWAVNYLGVVTLPPFLPTSALAGPVGDIHADASYVLLGLAGLHLLAALYHHVWLRDRVLARMLPSPR